MTINTAHARDRAEDVLQNLQKRAREWIDAEEGLVQSVRDLIDDNRLTPGEARRRLEEGVGRIKANKLWERISTNDRVVALADYRDELERRIEEAAAQVVDRIPVATKNDLATIEKRIKSTSRKVSALAKRVSVLEADA